MGGGGRGGLGWLAGWLEQRDVCVRRRRRRQCPKATTPTTTPTTSTTTTERAPGPACMNKSLALRVKRLETLLNSPPAQPVDLSSWSSFADSRGLAQWTKQHPENFTLLSKLLTFPLTLAAHAPATCSHVYVLGARAEATLPWIFWRELNLARPRPKGWHVHFIGPEAPEQVRARWPAPCNVFATFTRKLYHESALRTHSPDLYALFNPGLSTYPAALWHPTLDILLQHAKPLLVTGFNADDFAKDCSVSGLFNPDTCKHGVNPFASLDRKLYSGQMQDVAANEFFFFRPSF
jgi:hypothetical protein